ncbi:hypothetical protein L2E82_09804 [Cichorium intybus]|uniref:Uncharacterized protein n=1 Tax=Cichorium intybus TaxID=13427 RepID=A0ACB9GB74_CICIN|nr:hypothetical protein L2E82_09804 [Cichorium intybus]
MIRRIKVRVKELDRNIYSPWSDVDKTVEEEEVNVESKKELENNLENDVSSEMSEFDSSDCFSDEEREQSEEETVVPDSNFEENDTSIRVTPILQIMGKEEAT